VYSLNQFAACNLKQVQEVRRAVETERERSKSAYEALLVAARKDSETRAQDMIKYVAQMRDELLQMDCRARGSRQKWT
jgi:hypothetical protein